MPGTTESSVLVALSELQRIETNRIAEEAAREAELKQKEIERVRREREAREEAEKHRLRVAEAEARLRVAEEVRAHEAVKRAERVEEALRVANAEKAVLSDAIFALEKTPPPPPWHGVMRWMTSVALFGIAATALAAFTWPTPKPVPVIAPRPVPVQAQAPSIDPETAQKIASLEERLKKIMKNPPSSNGPKPPPHPHKPGPKPADNVPDLSKLAGTCDDPFCGLKLR